MAVVRSAHELVDVIARGPRATELGRVARLDAHPIGGGVVDGSLWQWSCSVCGRRNGDDFTLLEAAIGDLDAHLDTHRP